MFGVNRDVQNGSQKVFKYKINKYFSFSIYYLKCNIQNSFAFGISNTKWKIGILKILKKKTVNAIMQN